MADYAEGEDGFGSTRDRLLEELRRRRDGRIVVWPDHLLSADDISPVPCDDVADAGPFATLAEAIARSGLGRGTGGHLVQQRRGDDARTAGDGRAVRKRSDRGQRRMVGHRPGDGLNGSSGRTESAMGLPCRLDPPASPLQVSRKLDGEEMRQFCRDLGGSSSRERLARVAQQHFLDLRHHPCPIRLVARERLVQQRPHHFDIHRQPASAASADTGAALAAKASPRPARRTRRAAGGPRWPVPPTTPSRRTAPGIRDCARGSPPVRR